VQSLLNHEFLIAKDILLSVILKTVSNWSGSSYLAACCCESATLGREEFFSLPIRILQKSS